MKPREQFIKALKREPIIGHVPHFELVFFLTMESIGKIHPIHRDYSQWHQMSYKEKKLHLKDMALSYIEIAKKYDHSAIFVHPNPGRIGEISGSLENTRLILEEIRELSGDEYFLMIHGDPTYPIPDGNTMIDFSVMMYEEPEKIHEGSKRRLEEAMQQCEYLSKKSGLLDGYALCSDYCLNTNPFYSREMFEEFIGPYLTEVIAYYRKHHYYSIKHTDGNVMPILDQIVACKPDAIHSLDPQGSVDLKKVKKLYGDQVCLIGNVNCGLLQTGSEEEAMKDVRRSLTDGMPGYGYIFSTSNCVYTGLPLERYEMMHRIWKEEGIY